MITVNVSTLKNKLSAYLRKVRAGDEVLVMDRDRPVARLIAAGPPGAWEDHDAQFKELIRQGIIRPAKRKKHSLKWLRSHRIKLKKGVSVVAELLKEREEAPW